MEAIAQAQSLIGYSIIRYNGEGAWNTHQLAYNIVENLGGKWMAITHRIARVRVQQHLDVLAVSCPVVVNLECLEL